MSQNTPTDLEALKFAEHYVIYRHMINAFKHTFPRSKAKYDSLGVRASTFCKNPKVQKKIEQINKIVTSEALENTIFTVKEAIKELDENRTSAKGWGQAGPMVTATMGKAKIAGLLVDKVQTEVKTVDNFSEYMKNRSEQ